jgi:hypothetical protein
MLAMDMYVTLKHRLAPRLAVVFGTICVTACVYVEHRPASWGNITPATPSDDCVSFPATYNNKGNKTDGSVVFLATWLHPRNAPTRGIDKDLLDAQTVSLEFDGALLTLKTNGLMGAFHQWSFDKSKREFACRNGVLHISKGGDKSGQNVAAVGSDAIDLYRTQSELIVNSHGGSAGIALIIPMAEYGSAWARFPVQASSSSQTGRAQ